MKKNFIKITIISLLALIIPMSGGFCFSDLLGISVTVNLVQAANNIDNHFDVDRDLGVCEGMGSSHSKYPINELAGRVNKLDNGQNLRSEIPTPISDDGDNSVLPCCVGGTQPNFIIISQSLEIHQLFPFAIFNFEKLSLNNLRTISCQAPIKSPPELSFLKTTVLRI